MLIKRLLMSFSRRNSGERNNVQCSVEIDRILSSLISLRQLNVKLKCIKMSTSERRPIQQKTFYFRSEFSMKHGFRLSILKCNATVIDL